MRRSSRLPGPRGDQGKKRTDSSRKSKQDAKSPNLGGGTASQAGKMELKKSEPCERGQRREK